MDVYSQSRLSEQIEDGMHGIQYLDAKNQVIDLIGNESGLFEE